MPPKGVILCPGCNRPLRLPAELTSQAVRCPRCGKVIRITSKRQPAQPAEPLPPAVARPASDKGTKDPREISASVPAPHPESPQALPSLQTDLSLHPHEHLRRSRGRKWIVLGVFCCLALAAAAGYLARDHVRRWAAELRVATESGNAGDKREVPNTDSSKGRPGSPAVFPRRVLAIGVNHYLYANPVSYGERGHDLHRVVRSLARALHVPLSQCFELSDSAPARGEDSSGLVKANGEKGKREDKDEPPPARPPLKPLIEQTVERFLDTSRAQDRIVLLFCGHALVLENEACLVPLEGDLTDKRSLIPLRWLYDRLARCRARQKLIIVDTCRLDPSRDPDGPGSAPMPAKLDESLSKPPDGVQVWSSCAKAQYSYELEGGSVFLENLQQSLTESPPKKSQQIHDALPLDELAAVVNEATRSRVERELKAKQTPRLVGHESPAGAAYDPNEPEPERVDIPSAPWPQKDLAAASEIRSILREIDLPPIKLARRQSTPLQLDALIPFSAKTMAPYRADSSLSDIQRASDKYPLRAAVLKVVKLLNDEFRPEHAAVSFRESFSGVTSERMKAEILKEQLKPAKVLLNLQEALEELRKAGDQREQEPSKRWQAHYDYVLAQLLARIAYVSEYNLMLGKIRKDELPELTPQVHTGYRLSSQEKLQSGKEVRELAAESKRIFAKIAKEHAGTPWEILAKRARLIALGLAWEPAR